MIPAFKHINSSQKYYTSPVYQTINNCIAGSHIFHLKLAYFFNGKKLKIKGITIWPYAA